MNNKLSLLVQNLLYFLPYRATNGQTFFQVIFPTGIKVDLERNYWGIDVTIYAPRAEKEANEDGLCTYLPTKGDINTFGNSQRQEYLLKSQFAFGLC